MRFPFFNIPKRVTWEELSKNILLSIEMEHRQNEIPSIPTATTGQQLPAVISGPATAGATTYEDSPSMAGGTCVVGEMPEETLTEA